MKNKRHSIKDIAAEIGVSVTTVSFVLNGKAEEKKISKAVTEKILKYVEKIKYKPNQIAQSLRTGKSKILNKDSKSIDLIDLFKDRQIDGYIIIPSSGIMSKIKELIDEGIPVILFDRYFPELDSNYVIVNNKEASYNATQHLIANTYKNIGFITIDVDQTQMIDRLTG